MIIKKRFIFFVLIVLSLGGFWGRDILAGKFSFIENFKNKNPDKAIVDGAKFEFNQNYENITFKDLLVRNPDAPIKKEGFGSFYARAKSAVVVDAKTNTILHYQNAKERRAIASLTKVMTAVVVLENIDDLKNEIVTINEEVVSEKGTIIGCPNSGYCTSTRLQVGEKISAWSLFKAMVMNSTNDAATALAIHVAGSKEKFAEMMNDKVRELGLKDSNFCNPSGLDDEENPGACYSSAYDIARIAAYSLKYEEIWDTMKISNDEIFSVDGEIKHIIGNTNRLFDKMSNAVGGKTGFTYEAGKCLMGAAVSLDGNNKVVGVVLDDFYRWEDMENMLKWSFQAYQWKK